MRGDLETRRNSTTTGSFGGLLERVRRTPVTTRGNLTALTRFLARRRRDRRFRVQPYSLFQIANALAVAVSVFVLVVVFLDSYLPLWRSTVPRPVYAFFRFLTQFGKADWILIGTGVAVVIALLMEASALRPRERIMRAIRLFAAAYVFLSVAASGIIANLCKYIIGRARPKLYADNGTFSFDFWSWNPDWASFPSGHATTALAFGVALALLFPRLFWVFLCVGFWIAASRPFIGVHYPSDMLAGGLLGATIAWLMARAFARLRLVFGFDTEGRLVRRSGASGRFE
jgi:undecaprenyl-diphosphatase